MLTPSKVKRILFADDDPDDHYLFITALKEVNTEIQVQQFYKCDDILDCIKNDPPDIIFLDLNMPGNQDFECLKNIRCEAKLKDIPVVIYSTNHRTQLIEAAYQSGASKYLVKPSSIVELQRILREIVEPGQ